MKVVITGGAGFIGSHLVEQCLEKSWDVVVIDNLSNGSLKNLSFASQNSNFTFIEADIICDLTAYSQHFKECDFIFHLAGLADIVPSIENPIEYHRTNVDGTLNVLEMAKKGGVKKFLYAASSSCYGIPDNYPTSERDQIKPMYPYALTKRVGEEYVLHWGKTYDLPVISLRLFNVYGTRAKTKGAYGAVFKVFLAQKLAQKAYTVVGDGTQSRDFTYVTDIANAFIMAAQSDLSCDIMNVGTGKPQSVNRLVELLGGAVEYIPKRPGEPEITCADISSITEKLGWAPKVNFDKGVSLMLDGIDYWRDAIVWDSNQIASVTKSWFKCLGDKDE